MAKQLNVSLAFTADTKEAKAQLQDLQRQLNNILKTPSNKLGITDEIREAISATAELSSRLQQATNVNTGNLDFSKFNNSLKQSGQSLSSYGQQLQKLGPTGQQAFLTLTKSIATAEIPIKRTNALVKEFTTTLANTARWQVSSSVLHGLMGSMQSAYRYAQDLNESLNDIRIVTGQSVDQMARFAAEANAAAKALSATTVEYTNASLIYYQQGLSDQQVKERTDITIKMANVSKQSAEVVSDQMTAVWNNFYNGSKSLEYYADVMTALGAATASSADEIAGGLEKFAAIGETIGLSYEYAAAALATITSNTRQSEEVVGTALKTIFARIQGLNLGETLEDGTTLNKYSAALEKVGISIFDSAGELKRMDTILEEMGAKWETLNKAQQTALAQTVAGTRQYTQLVALMDNWDKGDSDSMQANLTTAYNSSGALQEQADIYAESWEAARDRVTAAAEKIYSALLDDDFFIDMLNGFEKILTFVSQLIDNLGGLQGVFLALGAIITKVFSAQISQGLTNMAYNIKMMTKSGRESVEKERRDFIDNAVNSIPQNNEYTTDVEKAQQESLRTELTLQAEYMDNAERMNSIEAETNKKLIERTKLLREQTVELQKQKEQVDKRVSDGVMDLRTDISAFNMENRQTGKALSYKDDIQPEISNIKSAAAVQAELKDLSTVIELVAQKSDKGKAALADIRKALEGLDTSADKDIARLVKEINQLGDSPDPEQLRQKLEALNLELEETIKISKQNIKDVVSPEAGKKVDALTQDLREQAQAVRDVRVANQEAKQSQEDTSKSISEATGAQKQWSDVMVESANVAFNVASAISMVSSAIDTLKDPDVSGMQKLVTVLSTMGMVLPTIISLIGTMKKLFSSETVAKIANAAATWAQVAAEKSLNKTKGKGSEITKKNIKETWQDTVWKSTKKENQDKYIEQVLKDKGYVRDSKNGGWGKTSVGKNGAKRFDPSTRISDDEAIKMATSDAQKMAGKSAFKALGSKVASAGIAAAGIAIIIGTVAMVVNQLNEAEKAVEKAKAAAQSLSENYDNVKASYDNFINAQSGYETATKSMEELTKGTVEYQEALLQANEAAGELLAKYKDLEYKVVDGKIEIDEDSLTKVKNDELKKMETAQAAKIAGQRHLAEAEMNLKSRDAARDMKSGSDGWQKAGNSAIGGILGAAGAGLAAGGIAGLVTGSVTGPGALITAAIGASIGLISGIVTGIVQETSTDTEQDAINALARKAEEDSDFLARLKAGEVSEKEFEELGIKDEGLIASLKANGDQIAELVGEMAANTAAINAQNDLVASNVLADNAHVQDSEYKDKIIDIAGDAYGVAYDKALKSDWVDTWGKDGISKATGVNDEAKKVFNEYLKYAGLEGQGYKLTDTTGTDKNRQFVYKDAEGNEKTVSLEAMQAARAAYEASETLDKSATKLAETFDKLAGSSNDADKALLSFASQKNFEGATKGEVKDIEAEVGNINDADDVEAYLDKHFGDGDDGQISDETAQSFGYESADAMVAAFTEKLSNAKEAWNNIKLPENFKFADDMSLETAQALENQIEQINLGPLGEQAGKEYVEKLNSMLGELDPEDQQKALESLAAIDWSDWDAMSQAKKIMKDFGVEIDINSKEWIEFANNMRIASGAIPDFSQLQKTLQNISGILNDLSFGDVISEEDYNTLIEYKSEWADLFILQADGTRKFIGNSEEMLEATRNNIAEERKELERRKKIIEEIEESKADLDISAMSVDKRYGDGKDGKISDANARNHGYENGEDMINNVMASDVQKLIESNEAVKELLTSSGYSNEDIAAIIQEARDGNRERLEAMISYMNEYMGQDLEMMEIEMDEMMASTATSIEELNQLWADGAIKSEESYWKQQSALISQQIEAAENLSQLEDAIAQSGGAYDQEQADNKLIDLAENYENCADEVKDFEAALTSNDQALIKEARDVLKVAVELNELAEAYDLDAEATANYADRLAENNGALKNGQKLTAQQKKAYGDMAIAAQRLDRGVGNVNKNLKDYTKVINTADRNSFEFSETMDALKTDIADIFNVADGNMFSDMFAEGLLANEDFQAALNGDVAALDRLRAAATVDIGNNIIADLGEQANTLQTEYRNAAGEIVQASYTAQSAWDYVRGVLADGFDINEINDEKFVESLNQMIQASGMTKEQIQSMLGSMGVSAEVVTSYKEMETEVPTYYEHSEEVSSTPFTYTDFDGTVVTSSRPVIRKMTIPGPPVKTMGYVPTYSVKTTSGDVSSGGTIDYSNTFSPASPPAISQSATNTGNTGGGGGGGGRTSKSVSKTKVNDVVERYKEVEDQLDDVRDSADKLSRSLDRLHGDEKIAAIEKLIAAEKREQELLEEKQRQAQEYLTEDLTALQAAAGAVGVSFTIEDGNLSNYEDQMTALYERLADEEARLEAKAKELDSIADDADYEKALAEYEVEEKALEELRERIQLLQDAIGQYDETKEILEDIDLQLDEMKGEEALPLVNSDLIDNLKEVSDILDDIEDTIDSLSSQADRLVGASRIAALQKIADLEKQRLQTLQRQKQLQEKDIADKRKAANEIAARNNLTLQYDESGNITNYDEAMGQMTAQYENLYNEYSADGFISEAEQMALDSMKGDIDELQEYIDAYSEAVENSEEIQKQMEEAYYAWQDRNAEILNEKLTLKIDVNDRELQKIDYYLSKMEGDFYQMAEAAAYMTQQQDIYNGKLAAYEQHMTDLETAYNNGEISLEAYVSGLQECEEGIFENLQALQDLDRAMMEYYGQTLAAAREELGKYTDQMALQSEALSYYQSLLTIMGKQNDYAKMDQVLRGQSKVIKDQLDVAKQSAEWFTQEAEKKKALYESALASGDSAAAELYKKEYEAALQASNEAQSEYLAKSQEYAESLKAVFENTLAGLNQDLEKSLTGGTSFDQISTEMKRAASLQEEYLTTTNQIYETNKLMHKTQQEIDKSSNSVAKERLKNFINETQQLQNKNKLSKYELQIQQAKYDLLMAEIALEEAQAAKSTVRLQRDSEGNFGYVYTADSSKVADAEQKLADAQNRLYNIGLEGANQYTEKYQQTLSEMYDTLTNLQQQYLNGAFATEEEYNAAVTSAKEYYYAKLEEYSSLHSIALQTDSRVVEDAWSSELSSMVYNTNEWKDRVEEYIGNVNTAFTSWHAEMETLLGEAGLAGDFSNLGEKVDEVTEDSEELRDEITNKVLPALKSELDAVSGVTGAWALQRQEVLNTMKEYEDLIEEIEDAIDAMLALRDIADDPLPNPPEVPEQEGSNPDPNPGSTPDPDPNPGSTPDPDPNPGSTPDPGSDTEEEEKDEGVKEYDQTTKTGVALAIWNGTMGWGEGTERRNRLIEKHFDPDEIQALVNDPKLSAAAKNGTWTVKYPDVGADLIDLRDYYHYDRFNTGGYTGSWSGSYGKLAMLDQKELVLNAGDTENFLASMELLNKIVSAIDLYSMNSQLGGALYSPSIGTIGGGDLLEQQVHIEASFPNVSSHSEIEEAFNNLVNQASQYANRR